MAAFIRLYLARAGRTLSPVFLAGESYGGFRAALLARVTAGGAGVAPSGLVLISPALDSRCCGATTRPLLPWAVDAAVASPPSTSSGRARRGGHGVAARRGRALGADATIWSPWRRARAAAGRGRGPTLADA